MKLCLYLALIIPLVSAHHADGKIETKMETQKHFFLFQDENNKIHTINLLQPAEKITVEDSDITFYYYSRKNKDEAIVFSAANFDGALDEKYFNPERTNYIITHGYSSNKNGHGISTIKNVLLNAEDFNIFVIDYSPIAEIFYTTTVQAIPQMGSIIAESIKKIITKYDIQYSKINFIAHSLGGQVIASVCHNLDGQPNSIVANDPALPLFNHNDLELRLDSSDAKFLQVIHSNGGFLGYRNAIGHSDYYPNGGGMNQPGCGSDLFGNCAHHRSTDFFIESLNSSSNFRALLCNSYDDFKNGLCNTNAVSYLGGLNLDKVAHGSYFLDTASSPPYALG